jgi:hypothetical protein
MKKVSYFLGFCSLMALSAAIVAQAKQEYKSGELQVIILPVGKQAGRQAYESRLEFRGNQNVLQCSLDFSSADSEHGFGVVKAEWTPDKQFFLFSLTSSGGHQSWHAPTYFYNRKTRFIHSLDDYQDGAGIANGDFKLVAPNTVETEIQKENLIPIRFKLSSLSKRIGSRAKPFRFSCAQGRQFRYDK